MEGSQGPKQGASRSPTQNRVVLELLVCEAALERDDMRVAKFAFELYAERRTGLRGRIRHRGISLLLDVLVVLAEQERAA